MTYSVLCILFLVPCLAVHLILWRHRPRRHLAALGIATAAVFLLTAVFDSLMIAGGLFTYTEEHLAGPRVGLAPIEDFAYPAAALLLCTALWHLPRRRSTERTDA